MISFNSYVGILSIDHQINQSLSPKLSLRVYLETTLKIKEKIIEDLLNVRNEIYFDMEERLED